LVSESAIECLDRASQHTAALVNGLDGLVIAGAGMLATRHVAGAYTTLVFIRPRI
jgi:hypothetical protein